MGDNYHEHRGASTMWMRIPVPEPLPDEERQRWELASDLVNELGTLPKLNSVIGAMQYVAGLTDDEVETELMIRELGKP